MNKRLNNKKAIITGGSRGIGEMIASGFCANGAKVYITARSKDTVLETAKIISNKYDSECIGIQSDISTLAGVQELSKIIGDSEDQLDILVNKTREEIAKDYVTREQLEKDLEKLIGKKSGQEP